PTDRVPSRSPRAPRAGPPRKARRARPGRPCRTGAGSASPPAERAWPEPAPTTPAGDHAAWDALPLRLAAATSVPFPAPWQVLLLGVGLVAWAVYGVANRFQRSGPSSPRRGKAFILRPGATAAKAPTALLSRPAKSAVFLILLYHENTMAGWGS